MLDETTKPTLELISVLEQIKLELESINEIRNEREKVLEAYKTRLLPNLLNLRRLNRISKDKLESRNDEIRLINQKLVSLGDYCENLTFEASCVNYEVSNAKQRLSPRKQATVDGQGDVKMFEGASKEDSFDPDVIDELGHEERTKMLEAEGISRKQLCDKLNSLVSEADEIEHLCQQSEQEINRVKPFIKQLVEKVDLGDTNGSKQDRPTS